jgi:DNA-binding GntR family transcriptional regulator
MTPERLADALREAIRNRALLPGELLVQKDLAAKYNVSRNPVREALRTLAAEGLIVMAHGERAYVRQLTVTDLQEIYDLRLRLEPSLAPFIIDNASRRDINDLRALAQEMAQIPAADDTALRAWLGLNYTFHQRLFALAGRTHTERILTALLELAQPYTQRNVGALGGRATADVEHLHMVDRIDGKDAPALAAIITEHMRAARDRVTAALAHEQRSAVGSSTTTQ